MYKKNKAKFIQLLGSFLLILALTLPTYTLAQAQTSNVFKVAQVNSDNFPDVLVEISTTDAQGLPVAGLSKDSFTVAEDGKLVNDFNLQALNDTSQPIAVAIALDASGSMNPKPQSPSETTPFENAVNAVKSFVQNKGDNDLVTILTFSDQVKVEQELTADKTTLENTLSTLQPKEAGTGYTSLNDAVVEAIDSLKDRPERRIVILLTDGQDNKSKNTFDQVLIDTARWKIPIYPIGFGTYINKDELNQLGSQSGGITQISPDSSTLEQAYANINNILHQRYQLEFKSSLQADGLSHQVTIGLHYQGIYSEQSTSFTARSRAFQMTLPDIKDGDIIGGEVSLKPAFDTIPAPPLAQLIIQVDGKELTTITSEPFEYQWDTTSVAPGKHEVNFTAIDSAGNKSNLTLQVEVKMPITMTLDSPVDGATVSGVTKIIPKIDHLFDVAKVEYFLDGQSIKMVDAQPFEYDWDTSNLVAPKTYTLKVVATDIKGNQATADASLKVMPAGGSGGVLIVIVGLVVVAGVTIPLALRTRRKKRPAPVPESAAIAQVKAQALVLREEQGDNPGQVWPLSANEIRMGRKRDENDIPLKGLQASRRQAVIQSQANGPVISSLSPDNPILVNGTPVLQPQTLKVGDLIQGGESSFRVEASS